MNLDFKCVKCGNEDYFVETIVLPEKNYKLKLDIGTYYLKICSNCGYTEIYSAKILNKSKENILNVNPQKNTAN
ncbi:MAG: zinc ribbon domain-containing protein [Fusobacterium sp. JB021]|nr:zinc ribbon domain-containing protein [Fusobacterium sp. JB020]MDP0493301.1 zinc ribbon domain-containing protein [Fusobacterium sp. JB021]MDP0506959.1 zinc ribbon domain-containing protein [Fusobacterium sp. JB019]